MNSAQIQAIVKQVLTVLGTLAAGTSFANYFDSSYVDAAVGLVGAVVVAISVIWSHQSNTAEASAAKLVNDPTVNKTVAAAAIANGIPSAVKG